MSTMDPSSGLRASGLLKRYGGVAVLRDVDLTVLPGRVTCLVGENGAGKSTLSSILAGVVRPDDGRMTLDGRPYAPAAPRDALRAGVAMVHQEIRMVAGLSVAENIFLGRLATRAGRLDRHRMEREARDVLRLLGADIDPRRQVGECSVAEQQEVEIAKALARDPRYVVFDEPSAALGGTETERVLDRIRSLRDHGVGVVFISHRLDEVRAIADEIVVLRDGSRTAHWGTGNVEAEDIIRAMVGRDVIYEHTAPAPPRQDVVLQVRGLARAGVFEGIEFDLAAGEIIGVAGLVGAGRTEMVRVLAGAELPDAGEIAADGRSLRLRGPRSAIDAGIAMVPEDRKSQGLLLDMDVAANLTLPWERSVTRWGVVTRGALRKIAREQTKALDVRGQADMPVGSLSGGNQQKVLIGKWLVKRPRVLILDEPTRGVDVGAKASIHQIVRDLASQGVGIIVVSSEIEEVIGLAHRVLVMAGGRQAGILPRAEATPEAVMTLAVGGAAA